MTRRNAISIRKEILLLLQKEKEISVRQIETKINTNFETTKRQVEDLASLGFVKVVEIKSHPRNNKPYKVCKITDDGLKWIVKNK